MTNQDILTASSITTYMELASPKKKKQELDMAVQPPETQSEL